jgi:hypothetical protein
MIAAHRHFALDRTKIPVLLKQIPRWLTWKAGPVKPSGKFDKFPINAALGFKVDGTNPKNWVSFEDACAAYDAGWCSGIGISLCDQPVGTWGGVLCGAHQYLIALDFDQCGQEPKIMSEIKCLQKDFGGIYGEISPSGNGIRLFTLSRELTEGGNTGDGREMYSTGRFMTVTGLWGRGEVIDATEKLSELSAKWFPKKVKIKENPKPAKALSHPESPEAIVRVKAQLASIDADCAYDKWRNIVWSVLSTGWSCAEELARIWSASGEKYEAKAFDQLFNDFDPSRSITLGTLDHWAREGGWIEFPGVRREAQRKENAEIGAGEQFSPQPEVMTCNAMLSRLIFLSEGSRVFDTEHPKHVLSFTDFKNATAASYTDLSTGAFTSDGKPKTRRIANSRLWLDSPQRLSAFGTTFDASAGIYAKDPNGKHCVNIWTGFDRSVDPGDADINFILAQIGWLFKGRANDFLDWLAHLEQHPGILPHTMWLHISSQTGTGRNAIARLLSRVFSGYAAMSLALEQVLDSGFNDELSAKLLAVVDEIRVGGKDQWRHSETLKQMITAQVRHINTKYGRKSMEANACRFLVFSNHRNAIPIDDTDRRIEVVICDEKPKDAEYYTKLYSDVDDQRVVAAFAHFLRQRDISSFNPGRHALRNADKAQVVAVTGSDEYSALVEFTENYTPPLATADRLALAAGYFSFSGDARRFSHAVMDAGWQKLRRIRLNGKRVTVYAKKALATKWIGKKGGYEEGLPLCDGGTLLWNEGE